MSLASDAGAADDGNELSKWQMTAYALPALPVSFLYIPLPILIPVFYSEQLGLSLATVGTFLFAAKLFDFFVDPMLGRLSDKTRSRFGRRRPWIVAGAPIMMVGAALVFMPPEEVSGWYLMASTMLVYFGASMLGLAYSAWGAEVVRSYQGRARLAGFREVASLIGMLIAGLVPTIAATMGHGVDRFTMSIVGWVVLILTPLSIWAALRFVPDGPPLAESSAEPKFGEMLRQVSKNAPFRLLCIGFFVLTIGISVTNSVLVFFIAHYLQAPELIGPVLMISFVMVLLFVPVWVRVSRRIGKHRAAGYSLLVAVICSSVFAFMLQPGDGYLFLILMAVLGAVSAAFMTLPVGIMGDVIDYDMLKHGVNRGGVFFGMWAFAQQVAPALAIGATLPFLSYIGFEPSGANSPEALQGLRYVYCFGPLPFYVIGAIMLLRFPIDARRHAIIRRRLDGREARLAAMQPATVEVHNEVRGIPAV